MHRSDNGGFHRHLSVRSFKTPKSIHMFSQKNVSKKALKRALLVKLTLVNCFAGIFLASVAHNPWVTSAITAVLVAMASMVTFYFWFDQPEKEFGPVTRSQVIRVRLKSWIADLQVRSTERAFFKAWLNLRSSESLW